MITESDLATYYVESNKEREYDWNKVNFDLETHYNSDGKRGSVDLVIEEFEYDDHGELYYPGTIDVFEFKSEPAVDQATGPNEIIRQFKRHKKYFFQGSDYDKGDYWSISFFLVFSATEYNIDFLQSNRELFTTVIERDRDSDYTSSVLVTHPGADAYWFIYRDEKYMDYQARAVQHIVTMDGDYSYE